MKNPTSPDDAPFVILRLETIEILARAVVIALGLRVLYLFVRYIFGAAGIQRFHVETWALIFIGVGSAFRLTQSHRPGHESGKPTAVPLRLWVLFCGLGVALYWPALSVGFLSDDYVLVTHASNWSIGPVTPALFRPLPLFIWALLLNAGAGATILHLLNLLLHGTNAYLTTRVIAGWMHERKWSVLGGLIVLTFPLAPEAVVWVSGIFDLLATTLVLTCILLARRYDYDPAVSTRVQFIAAGVAAVASKETAAIVGGLVLLDAWARNARSRQLLIDTAVLITIIGIVSVIRLESAYGMTSPPLDKYVLQRALFGTFGGLAVPWHIDVIRRLPWISIVGVVAVVCLLLMFFLQRAGSKTLTKLTTVAALWVLLPIVPVFPILFIAPDLQQSRYLYLSAIGWAALMVAVASEARSRHLQPVSVAAVGGLIAIASYGTVLHLRPWNEAALVRETVESSARRSRMERCAMITLSKLPDSVRGAYVFRNGGAEAFARDLHLNAVVRDDAAGPCSFQWSDARRSFMPAGTE